MSGDSPLLFVEIAFHRGNIITYCCESTHCIVGKKLLISSQHPDSKKKNQNGKRKLSARVNSLYFVELSVRWPCSSFYCRGPSSLSRLLASLLPPPGGSDCVIPETVGREGGPLSSVSPLPPSSYTPTHCQYLITGRRQLPPFSSRLCCSKKRRVGRRGKERFFLFPLPPLLPALRISAAAQKKFATPSLLIPLAGVEDGKSQLERGKEKQR